MGSCEAASERRLPQAEPNACGTNFSEEAGAAASGDPWKLLQPAFADQQ